MKYLKLVLLVLFCLSVVACTAAKQGAATTSASMEWRVKSLEENFLNFREKQRLEADENAQNQESVDERLKSLEEQVVAVKSGETVMDAPADSADKPPMGKGWVTDLKPEEEGWVEGQKAKGDASMAESSEDKPWDKVPGPPPVIPEPKVIKRPGTPATKTAKPVKAAKPRKTVSGSQSMYDKGLAKYNGGDFEIGRASGRERVCPYV